jgi:hypothetical protein
VSFASQLVLLCPSSLSPGGRVTGVLTATDADRQQRGGTTRAVHLLVRDVLGHCPQAGTG